MALMMTSLINISMSAKHQKRNVVSVSYDLLGFLNCNLLYSRMNSHYEKKKNKTQRKRKRGTIRLKHTENVFRKNLQLKGV